MSMAGGTKKPSAEEVSALKAKHGDLWFLETEIPEGLPETVAEGAPSHAYVLHKQPSQAAVDEYLFATYLGSDGEMAAGNFAFDAIVWPEPTKLSEMFDEAAATVGKFAAQIIQTVGGSETDMAGVFLRPISSLSDEEKAELEARVGKLDLLVNAHPRDSLRVARLPIVGLTVFRRPPRLVYAPFVDAKRTPEMPQAARELCAECAVTDQAALPGVFAKFPAISFYLSFNLAGLAGDYFQVKSGKL